MKKNSKKSFEDDELRPEYDLSQLKGRVLGKHYEHYSRAATAEPKGTFCFVKTRGLLRPEFTNPAEK